MEMELLNSVISLKRYKDKKGGKVNELDW
jgi:hypothetical protein